MLPVLPFLAAAACAAPPPSPEPSMPTSLTSFPDVAFVAGPALDAPDLRTQLAAAGSKLLRLPVIVEFDDEHRLGVVRAWLGTSVGDPAPGAVQLKLDDTAMGVAILDSLRAACPPGARCAVEIDATWGPALKGLPTLPGAGPVRDTVAVRRFVGLQGPGAVVRIQAP